MVSFLLQFKPPFGLNAPTLSLRTKEKVRGTHPFSFRKDSVVTTGLKPRFRASSRFRSPLSIPESGVWKQNEWIRCPKSFASHHPAWGRSDSWFRCELIYGRCRKTCSCFLLAESWKNFAVRLAQGLSLVVKNYCPEAESIAGILDCCLPACFHCGRKRLRDLWVC